MLKMGRNCNLELRLVPPSSSSHDQLPAPAAMIMTDLLREGGGVGGEMSPERQQITIFYNGKISVCEVTEHQARAIIMLAGGGGGGGAREMTSPTDDPPPPLKRSLQQFLQNRSKRHKNL